MISPVVQTRFGSRPLLEVPAMNVPGTSDITVTSLAVPRAQAASAPPVLPVAPPAAHAAAAPTVPVVVSGPVALPAAVTQAPMAVHHGAVAGLNPFSVAPMAPMNPFPGAANPMLGSGLFNIQPTSFSAGAFPGTLQPSFPGIDARHNSAPQGPLYNAQGRQYFYGPNGEIIFPPPQYPGVANPFTGAVPNCLTHPQGYNPYGGPPGRMVYPPFEPRPFNVSCELEFGRITHIDLRDSPSTFRGIPDFIRLELLRTYGAEPHTDVKIKFENGEFHIYANNEKHRKKDQRGQPNSRESDSEDESYYDGDYGETDVDSYAQIKPRQRGEKPRRIVREKGWNRFR